MDTSNRMTLRLMRIDPVKYATIAAIATALIMLVIFVPFMLLFSAVGASQDFGAGAAIFGGGLFVIILAPIFYGIMVFIVTLITTAIINFILKKTGGLDIDFEKAGLGIQEIGNNQHR